MLIAIEKQTQEIAEGVHLGKSEEDIGAGDQVMLTNSSITDLLIFLVDFRA